MPSDRVVKALKLSNAMFEQLFGVQKETFHTMHTLLLQAFQIQHMQGGRPPKLTVGDKLLLTLQYWQEYRSMDHLAYEYEVHKSLVYRAILWVEQTLSQDPTLRVPGKKALRDADPSWEVVLVDVTEHPIVRQKIKKSIIPAKKSGTPY